MNELSLTLTSDTDSVTSASSFTPLRLQLPQSQSPQSHSPLTQSPRSVHNGSTLVDSDVDASADDEQQAMAPARLHSVVQLAEQISMLQTKVERLDKLRDKFQELPWFDNDDMELLAKEHHSAQFKLDAIKAAVQQGENVYLHVTLKRREAFLENAVRQHLLDPEKDKPLFHALVKKQVYLTRLAENRLTGKQ